MSFFEQPIINSPYDEPKQHWKLVEGRPTDERVAFRRKSELISAMPKTKSAKPGQSQLDLSVNTLGSDDVDFNVTEFVNEIRREVEVWRNLPNPNQWQVTPTTQRLLEHWRKIQKDTNQTIRPFFCQLEAVETAIL